MGKLTNIAMAVMCATGLASYPQQAEAQPQNTEAFEPITHRELAEASKNFPTFTNEEKAQLEIALAQNFCEKSLQKDATLDAIISENMDVEGSLPVTKDMQEYCMFKTGYNEKDFTTLLEQLENKYGRDWEYMFSDLTLDYIAQPPGF